MTKWVYKMRICRDLKWLTSIINKKVHKSKTICSSILSMNAMNQDCSDYFPILIPYSYYQIMLIYTIREINNILNKMLKLLFIFS